MEKNVLPECSETDYTHEVLLISFSVTTAAPLQQMTFDDVLFDGKIIHINSIIFLKKMINEKKLRHTIHVVAILSPTPLNTTRPSRFYLILFGFISR